MTDWVGAGFEVLTDFIHIYNSFVNPSIRFMTTFYLSWSDKDFAE